VILDALPPDRRIVLVEPNIEVLDTVPARAPPETPPC
jgi:hypothetical protein